MVFGRTGTPRPAHSPGCLIRAKRVPIDSGSLDRMPGRSVVLGGSLREQDPEACEKCANGQRTRQVVHHGVPPTGRFSTAGALVPIQDQAILPAKETPGQSTLAASGLDQSEGFEGSHGGEVVEPLFTAVANPDLLATGHAFPGFMAALVERDLHRGGLGGLHKF